MKYLKHDFILILPSFSSLHPFLSTQTFLTYTDTPLPSPLHQILGYSRSPSVRKKELESVYIVMFQWHYVFLSNICIVKEGWQEGTMGHPKKSITNDEIQKFDSGEHNTFKFRKSAPVSFKSHFTVQWPLLPHRSLHLIAKSKA